jgi:hypothetical protein
MSEVNYRRNGNKYVLFKREVLGAESKDIRLE